MFGPYRIEHLNSALIRSAAEYNGTEQQRVHATRFTRYSPMVKEFKVSKEFLALAGHTDTVFGIVEILVDIAEIVHQAIVVRVRRNWLSS